ncbi:MAG: hypothetical protein WC773_01225 [Patescibacteria group bacterium]|jgi:hypothetical protein
MKRIKFLLLLVLAFSAFVVYLIITNSDPYTASTKLKWLFYLAIFCLIFSSTSFFRLLSIKSIGLETVTNHIFLVMRQGAIIAAVACIILVMQSLRVLSLLDCLMIFSSAFLFELFFWVRVPLKLRA